MENSTTRRRNGAALCAALFATTLLTIPPDDAAAQFPWSKKKTPQTASKRSTDNPQASPGSTRGGKTGEISLNFFQASWDKVIKSVCEQSGSEPVMDSIPPGKFTRYDRKRHTRTEAVRVLNRELEPKGYRLIEKGRHLDLLRLRSARAEYYRPELPNRGGTPRLSSAAWSSEPTVREPKRNFDRVSAPHNSTARNSRGAIQQAAGVNASPGRQPQRSAAYDRAQHLFGEMVKPTPAPIAQPNIIKVVQPRSRRAVDIAKLIYNDLKNRCELANRGPSGLPAFNVLAPPRPIRPGTPQRHSAGPLNRRVQFSIGIDTGRNELVISAPPKLNQSIGEMIRYLDSVTVNHGETVRLVGTNTNSQAIAQTLTPQLDRLAQAGGAKTNQPNNTLPPMKKQGGDIEKIIPRDVPLQAIPQIRGRVVIQYVPGVGLVVRGNEADVEAVIKIIEELDKQAEFTTPNIQLHSLRHVNSRTMAQLLAAVYQQLAAIRAGGTTTTNTTSTSATVAFIPIVSPNAILILSSKTDLLAVQKLIDELDKPIDPTKEYRVFRLKYGVASQIVAHLDGWFQQQTGGAANQATTDGLAARVRAIADVRTNSVIIEAPPNDMAVVANLIRRLDQERVDSVSRIKKFALKNAVAQDLADLINAAIQGVVGPPQQIQGGGAQGGASSQALRDAKSMVLEFMSSTGDNKRIIRSGILADIRVTADPQTNSLLVTAPETSMKLMEALITELDAPSTLVAEIKVFSLANGDATAMVTLLNTLFTGTTQGGTAIPLALADDASAGLIPLRFSVDARTNSIIAVGGAAALTVVEAVVLRLDESDTRQRATQLIRLRNAPAADIATAINNFLTAQRGLFQIDPTLVTNMELLEREIIVVAEPITNSLLLSTTPRYEKEIIELIRQLDAAPPQVVIQALIVEVALDNTDEFGIELGFQDSMFFNRSILSDIQTISATSTAASGVTQTADTIVSSVVNPGFNFNNQPPGSSGINPSSIATQALNNFSLGRINADLGYGGLVLSASSSSISALLRALSAKRTIHVLSRPQITTLDNQVAQIQVGQLVPRVTGFNPATGTQGASPIVNDVPVGIILTVTPRISPDGVIVMEVVAEKSQLSGLGVPIFTDLGTGNVVESPIIDTTNARTTLAVPNGQTVVMGGMITKTDDTIQRKVPWLGDIPILGYAFRYDSTSTRRTELLIFLTPRIIKNDADSELFKQIESERMHFIERDAERIHGPLYAVPAADASMGGPTPLPVAPMPTPKQSRLPNFDDDSIPTTTVPANGYRASSSGIRQTGSQRFADAGGRTDSPQRQPKFQPTPSPFSRNRTGLR